MNIPTGYTETDSGLIVPEAVGLERETWLHDGDEMKALKRAQDIGKRRGLQVPLLCTHEKCKQAPLGATVLDVRHVAGGIELVCRHKVRVVAWPSRPRRGPQVLPRTAPQLLKGGA